MENKKLNFENAALSEQELENISGGASAASADNSTPKYQVGQTVIFRNNSGDKIPGVVLKVASQGPEDIPSWVSHMAPILFRNGAMYAYTVQLDLSDAPVCKVSPWAPKSKTVIAYESQLSEA